METGNKSSIEVYEEKKDMSGHRRQSERVLAEGVVWKRKRRDMSFTRDLKKISIFLYFTISVIWMELIFHIRFFDKVTSEIWLAMLFSVCVALIPAVICSLLPKKASKVAAIIFSAFIFILFGVQTVYYQVFKVFMILYSVGQGTGQILQFWREILTAIRDQWLTLLLLLVPLIFICTAGRKVLRFGRTGLGYSVTALMTAVLLHILLLGVMRLYGTDLYSPYDLYYVNKLPDFSMQKLGLITTMRLDLKMLMFGDKNGGDIILDNIDTTTPPQTASGENESTTQPEPQKPIEEILDYVLDTSPNILDIDFQKLAAEETDSNVATLHTYFASATPTNKNKYTGMFEGYNLVKLTAEGFNTYAVNEEVTPTLYKLANSGFVFNNFYNPTWYASTIDGEWTANSGLLPRTDCWAYGYVGSNKVTMPFALGNMFTSIGYSTYAYHNHTFSYYKRNLSHPLMGYIYKGLGLGLEVRKTWPESDLEMINLSMPDYIDKVPFHAYYMTVSGHLKYTFTGNAMAKKNKAAVDHLDYSEECKAYLACNIELDKAVAKLIEELDAAGLLETTVIVLSGDHDPYGLSTESFNEFAGHVVEQNFEKYKSTLILWSASMDEPVIVDKYCCSLDIVPTLCNLFGLEYDSRLYMGQDILSDAEPLVIFGNRSFITDKVMYNSSTGEVTMLTDEELPEKYISNMRSIINNKFKISKAILNNDYYAYIQEYTSYGRDKALYPDKYDFPVTKVKGKDY